MKIYFDNAATTAPLAADAPAFIANPSSPHGAGIAAERELARARKELAGVLSCRDNEIIFTSGGTESNNLALLGWAFANRQPTIFAAPWEHPSVLEPLKFAKERGLAQTVIAPPEEINAGETGLVSISRVCHETGDINDVNEIAARLKKANPKIVVHVDGAQGFCKEKTELANIDMYSFSGHKIHGSAGVGGLFVRSGVRLVPLFHGGGQEGGIRAGTENMPGITQTVSAAARLHALREENHAHVSAVKRDLVGVTNRISDAFVNCLGETSPYIANISFLGVRGETLVHLLSERGVYASMGAACRSRKKQKSALELMGFPRERAESAVRFSFSHMNTLEEAAAAKEIIVGCVSQLRRILR